MNLYDLAAARPERDESGDKAAEELFDTAALLDVLDNDIDRLRGDGELDENTAVRWSRVIRVSMARLESLACRLTDASIRPGPQRVAGGAAEGGPL